MIGQLKILLGVISSCFIFLNAGVHYNRIVSLSPSVTESLFLLELEEKIIGVTTFCDRPKKAQKKEKIGSVTTPNIEKIISLSPDLILATPTNKEEVINKLQKLKLNIIVLPLEKSFSDICSNFLTIGKITNSYNKAKKIIDDIKNKVSKLICKNTKKQKVFVEIGANPLITAGENTFINEMIELAGGKNIISSIIKGYQRINIEEVIKKNPDVILIASMGINTQYHIKKWAKYKNINAVKNKRVYSVDAHNICTPNPVAFLKGLIEVKKHLNEK